MADEGLHSAVHRLNDEPGRKDHAGDPIPALHRWKRHGTTPSCLTSRGRPSVRRSGEFAWLPSTRLLLTYPQASRCWREVGAESPSCETLRQRDASDTYRELPSARSGYKRDAFGKCPSSLHALTLAQAIRRVPDCPAARTAKPRLIPASHSAMDLNMRWIV